MANVHMVIGVGEAVITSLVVAAIGRTRKDLLEAEGEIVPAAQFVVYGLILALGLALFISPFASPWPDGLEKVAIALGFDQRAVTSPVIQSPVADYRFYGINSAVAGTALAGGIGTLIVFGLSFLLARFLVPKSDFHSPSA
jgi:ABC-type Co2+ transport system permease subunit